MALRHSLVLLRLSLSVVYLEYSQYTTRTHRLYLLGCEMVILALNLYVMPLPTRPCSLLNARSTTGRIMVVTTI